MEIARPTDGLSFSFLEFKVGFALGVDVANVAKGRYGGCYAVEEVAYRGISFAHLFGLSLSRIYFVSPFVVLHRKDAMEHQRWFILKSSFEEHFALGRDKSPKAFTIAKGDIFHLVCTAAAA